MFVDGYPPRIAGSRYAMTLIHILAAQRLFSDLILGDSNNSTAALEYLRLQTCNWTKRTE